LIPAPILSRALSSRATWSTRTRRLHPPPRKVAPVDHTCARSTPLSTLFIGLGFHHTSFWPPPVPSATSRVLLPIGIHLRMTRHQDPTCAWVPSGGRFHGNRFLIKYPAVASVWSVVHCDDDHKRGGDGALITAIILSTWRFCVVTRIESG
jgi:hypothetical protein